MRKSSCSNTSLTSAIEAVRAVCSMFSAAKNLMFQELRGLTKFPVKVQLGDPFYGQFTRTLVVWKFSKDEIRNSHAKVRKYCEDHNLLEVLNDPSRIFNMDEKGFILTPNKEVLLVRRGDKATTVRRMLEMRMSRPCSMILGWSVFSIMGNRNNTRIEKKKSFWKSARKCSSNRC